MKKFSWGTGITIVIIVFLIVTILQVVVIHYWVDYDLVEEDYYAAEIAFQSQIDKVKRTNNLPEQLSIKLNSTNIEFNFPSIFDSNKISGVISYYKPSDDLLDKKQTILLDDQNKMVYNTSELSTGLWKVKVNWAVEGVEYFTEQLLMVP